ncbi:hypothetical protein FIBSPDRAFT_967533 [Athelia psychrophila]|uniref:DUF6532 domain-containing protein n=1 Tax=Athelia psychrophila TaxID=1759441 RepID=A0A167VM91_9AGAM|nr:hypothetical protein FIBSPDRAFT_967533 [Fibularhizoctonia sp. CBS 109695]
MQDGKDENDRTNNLTHPAIAELCKVFFYGSTTKLGHAFSDEFGAKVPSMAVALVITAIKCALDEWAAGSFKRAPFQADTYSPVYKHVVGLIQKVVADEYHGSKFERARRDWSAGGSMRVDDQSKTGMADLEVQLD